MAGQKKQMTMQQAIMLMVIGGIMLTLGIFIPTEEGSSAQMWKIIMGFIGFCVLGAGCYLRPMKPKVEDKKWIEREDCALECAGRRDRPAVRRFSLSAHGCSPRVTPVPAAGTCGRRLTPGRARRCGAGLRDWPGSGSSPR
jgi:hypothetical protein